MNYSCHILIFFTLFTLIIPFSPVSSLEKSSHASDNRADEARPAKRHEQGNVKPGEEDGETIEIALGDLHQELWTEIKMTPDLKAFKMSANKKHKHVKSDKKTEKSLEQKAGEKRRRSSNKYHKDKNV